jgi:hypothetical protein
MKRYNFSTTICKPVDINNPELGHNLEEKKIILYKCLICNSFVREWDDSWDDAKKAEVKTEVDAHHNDHIVDETTDV